VLPNKTQVCIIQQRDVIRRRRPKVQTEVGGRQVAGGTCVSLAADGLFLGLCQRGAPGWRCHLARQSSQPEDGAGAS